MENQDNINTITKLIGTDINNYTITKYISSGSFGDVFEAKNKKTGELVALKIPIKNEERDGQKSLIDEGNIYKKIMSRENGIAEMKVIKDKDRKIIVMDLLGSSLESLLETHKKIGMKTIILLSISMLDIIKHIHNHGYIHRDIKPDNFVIGYDDANKLYCIDFGLSKRYITKNNEHISFSNTRKFVGTARYASIAAHKQKEQSRKDDLESIAYILVYLYKGKLPWMGIKNKDKKEKYRLIGEKKDKTKEEELCSGMPKEFVVFLKYVKNLDFNEKPHYSALKKMFMNLYKSRNYKNNNMEWYKE
jgi:serine/threonine protein kinase